MSKKIENEGKFYCDSYNELLSTINKCGLKKVKEEFEIDEYFVDINGNFKKNRSCLRMRITDNKHLEVAFKGASRDFSNNHGKTVNSINVDISNYESISDLLFSLGYLSYSIVNKTRVIYSKNDGDFEYNVMVDTVDGIGTFVKYELLYCKDDLSVDYLQDKLKEFVLKFKSLNFQNANSPYCDFSAYKTFTNAMPPQKLTTILFDLDGTLINSEKNFFESFREVIQTDYDYLITYKEYEENELKQNANLIKKLKEDKIIGYDVSDELIMQKVYLKYEQKFIELLDENEVTINFELLKQLKNKGLNLALVSTSRRKFIDLLLNKLKLETLFDVIVSREDVERLKPAPDAYEMALNSLNVLSDNCIAFEDSKRGIISSKNANIKTIQVTDFCKEKVYEADMCEKLSRVLLPIINYAEVKNKVKRK